MLDHARRLAVVAALALGSVATAHADTCDADKLRAMAKLEGGQLSCVAKAAKTGSDAALAACLDKAAEAFAVKFANVGTCSGDQAVCETTATACLDAVTAAITDAPPSKCAAATLTAASKYVKASLTCMARSAQTDRLIDLACLGKASTKFSAAIDKAGACSDDDAFRALVTDACIDAATEISFLTVTSACPWGPPPAVCNVNETTACYNVANLSACTACCQANGCFLDCQSSLFPACTVTAGACAASVNEVGCAEECCGS